jgi:hypothetical protein
MHLWQMDLVGGVYLADGREAKLLTGIDDHSRFVVVSALLAVPSGRAVCEAFAAAMRRHGIPSEVLTDNGKQFTGRFTQPRPAEVLFERVCRENGITARLTKPRSPTTTGKIERFHRTLRQELLNDCGPFADLPAAQAAIDAWVHAYNHNRPHQALDMATPASLFRPTRTATDGPGPTLSAPAVPRVDAADGPAIAGPAPAAPLVVPTPMTPGLAPAVELDAVIDPTGTLAVLPSVQRIKMGKARAGRTAHLWVNELSVHILIDGALVKTVPSNLNSTDLDELRMRGAHQAGPPPTAVVAARNAALTPGAVLEVDRAVDSTGFCDLDGHRLYAGTPLAGKRVTLRLDGHLVHIVADDILAKTLASPIPTERRASVRGARIATGPLPAPRPGPISITRRVSSQGEIMVTRQRLRVGRTYYGKTALVLVEDTHFRVLIDGEEVSLHARADLRPVTRFKAYKKEPSTTEGQRSPENNA